MVGGEGTGMVVVVVVVMGSDRVMAYCALMSEIGHMT